jgi:hypothetical protein
LNVEEQIAFFKTEVTKHMTLGIKRDLSLTPELFGKTLKVKGLFIWERAKIQVSLTLSTIECDVILYNETAADKVKPPLGYELFHIRDLQEFPYVCAVRVHVET